MVRNVAYRESMDHVVDHHDHGTVEEAAPLTGAKADTHTHTSSVAKFLLVVIGFTLMAVVAIWV